MIQEERSSQEKVAGQGSGQSYTSEVNMSLVAPARM